MQRQLKKIRTKGLKRVNNTAWIIAAAAGLELLIDAGADVNIRDGMGRSAIDILMESGDRGDMPAFRKCVSLLTDAGAELVHGLYDEN